VCYNRYVVGFLVGLSNSFSGHAGGRPTE